MIVTAGPRRAAVAVDEVTAVYPVERVDCETVDPDVAVTSSAPTRAVVEILRQGGGLAPRALVGGIFTPSDGGLMIKVNSSAGGLDSDVPCTSQLWRPLLCGLPLEFVDSVMGGLVRRARLPAGTFVVDRGGFDPVESSPLAFELAAELLCEVLAAQLAGLDVESVVRRALESWP